MTTEAHNSDKYKPSRFFSSHLYPAITPPFLERLKEYIPELRESKEATDKSRQPSNPYIILGLLSFCVLLLTANSVIAFKTIKTIEMPFGYIAQTVADQWYAKDLTLASPDGISNVIFAEVILKGDFQANTKIYIEIDNHECEETYWAIPNQNVADYTVKFDCSNLVDGKTGGTYTAKVKTDKVAQNIYASLRFTYYNDPELDLKDIYKSIKTQLQFFGTEYAVGDDGRVFLQLLDEERKDVNDAYCYLTAYYPNNTKFRKNILMQVLEENGLYYHDFTVPDELGNYMLSALCKYPTEESIEVNKTYKQDDGNPDQLHDYNYFIRANKYNISCTEGVEYAEICWHGKVTSSSDKIDVYYDTTKVINDWNPPDDVVEWHCIEFPESYISSGLNEFHYFGIERDYVGGGDTLYISEDNVQNQSYYYFYGWNLDTDDTYYIRMNVTCIDNITYNETGYTEIKGAGEVHVSSGNISAVAFVENVSVVANVSYVAEVGTLPSNGTSISFAGGTEYISNETGLFVIQFMRTVAGNPSPINNGECNATFYYPNQSVWLDFVGFTYLSGSNGLYLYEETIPYIEGIYTIDGKCTRGGITAYDSHTFHVSQTLNTSLEASGIWSKLRNIQDEITSVNDTVKSINITSIAEVNQTWFDEKFNQTYLNQQQVYQWLQDFNITNEYRFNITWQNQDNLYIFMQNMNATIINNQQAIISNITIVYNLLTDVYDEVTESILQSVA